MIFNHELPPEVQQAILAMDPGDALPLGIENDEPMILLRLSDGADCSLPDRAEPKTVTFRMPW